MKKLFILTMTLISMSCQLIAQAETINDTMTDQTYVSQRALTEHEFIVILSSTGSPEQLAVTNSDATTINDCWLTEAGPSEESSVSCAIQFDVKNGLIFYSVQISNGAVSSARISNIVLN